MSEKEKKKFCKDSIKEFEHLSITEDEDAIVNSLKRKFKDVFSDEPEQIRNIFKYTRILLTKAAGYTENDFYAGQIALMGIIYRTYELFVGGIEQTLVGNRHVFASCMRGLIETLGCGVIAYNKDNLLPNLIHQNGVAAGKLRNAAFQYYEGLKEDTKRLDSIVHANSTSLLLGFRPIHQPDRLALFALPSPGFQRDELYEAIMMLINICNMIHKKVDEIFQEKSSDITSGKVIAKKFNLP